MISASKNFKKFQNSIEDAFEEDADDPICLYGATNERAPIRSKNNSKENEAEVEIKGQDPFRNTTCLKDNKHQGFLPLPTEPDSISRDSDSLIAGDDDAGSCYRATPYSSWWCFHPKVREKWRVVAGAFILFIVGSALIIAGIIIEVVPIKSLSGFVFLIAGLICFIPGVYHVVFIIMAVRGRQGYDFYSLPLFN